MAVFPIPSCLFLLWFLEKGSRTACLHSNLNHRGLVGVSHERKLDSVSTLANIPSSQVFVSCIRLLSLWTCSPTCFVSKPSAIHRYFIRPEHLVHLDSEPFSLRGHQICRHLHTLQLPHRGPTPSNLEGQCRLSKKKRERGLGLGQSKNTITLLHAGPNHQTRKEPFPKHIIQEGACPNKTWPTII